MTQWEKLNQWQISAQQKAVRTEDEKIKKFLLNAAAGFESKKSKLTLEQAEMLV